jgi:hypothetical protein
MSRETIELALYKVRSQYQPNRRDQNSIIASMMNTTIPLINDSKFNDIKRYISKRDIDTLIRLCNDPRCGVYHVYKAIYETGDENFKIIIRGKYKIVFDDHTYKEGSEQKTIYPLKFQKYENQAEETRTEIL